MMHDAGRRAATFRTVPAVAMIVLAGMLLSLPPGGQVQAGQPADPASLVERLGDPHYVVRLEAADRLLATGEAARGALVAGLESDDPQVRRSCRRLLAEVMAATIHQRLLASEPGKPPGIELLRTLPG